MELLYSILSTVHIIVCVLLILFILLQKGTGDGLFTSSSSNSFMSGVGVVSILSKLTKYLGIFFLVNTLILATLSVRISNKNKVVIEAPIQQEKTAVPIGLK